MMMEMDIHTELKQVMVKENLVDGLTMPSIRVGFYPDVIEYLKVSKNKEADVLFAKIKRSRMVKLSRLACAGASIDIIGKSLTPEEQVLYTNLLESCENYWRNSNVEI